MKGKIKMKMKRSFEEWVKRKLQRYKMLKTLVHFHSLRKSSSCIQFCVARIPKWWSLLRNIPKGAWTWLFIQIFLRPSLFTWQNTFFKSTFQFWTNFPFFIDLSQVPSIFHCPNFLLLFTQSSNFRESATKTHFTTCLLFWINKIELGAF